MSEIRGKRMVCVWGGSTKGAERAAEDRGSLSCGRPHNRIEAATTKEIVTPERAGTRE